MTRKLELYRCSICGNVVEFVHEGMGELVCCEKPMDLLNPNNQETDVELFKHHIPTITENDDYYEIQIGEQPHPMVEEHYIEFIECYSTDGVMVFRKFLTPGMSPNFRLPKYFSLKRVAAYCNIHGLWENYKNVKERKPNDK